MGAMLIWLVIIPVCLCSNDVLLSIELMNNWRVVKLKYFSYLNEELYTKNELSAKVAIERSYFKSLAIRL